MQNQGEEYELCADLGLHLDLALYESCDLWLEFNLSDPQEPASDK